MIELTGPAFSNDRMMAEIDKSVLAIYELCGASQEETLVFTSCEAEAVAQVFYSALSEDILKSGKNHILVGSLERSSQLLMAAKLEDFGCMTEIVPVNSEGMITADILNLFVTPKTALFSISLAAPVIGTLMPIKQIAEYCKKHHILLHVSVTGALGRVFFRLADLPIDFITFEGSSIGGPITTGVLIAKKKPAPLIPNSTNLNPFRGGSFDPSMFIELGRKARELLAEADHQNFHLVSLATKLQKELPFECLLAEREKLPGTLVFSLGTLHAELMLFHLKQHGIFLSIGGDDLQKLENILVKCGYDIIIAKSAIAFNLEPTEQMSDIAQIVATIKEIHAKLSKISSCLEFDEDV